ncbi:hypothetical protein PV08_09003 [Exophiala spinifera]|uniref:Major facilitator superfamily (MFS) profile domain-containing protein n=1 Tax=Exophiala spinifera TaxID=91928 RepID=A0A0D1Y9S7_9EURO|nr:uncharacterized protein PV08_09003 [Exophiala spinifera]KIW11731.1 hypothetical protein PV08_09003 [Exophiala spinifera]
MFNEPKDASSKKPLETIHLEEGDLGTKSAAEKNHASSELELSWSPEEETGLVKKIDRRVFPMLCIVFALSLLDRVNIGAAYIAGMGKDLGLAVGSRYSVVLLMFFPGYTLLELPSNYLIRRVGPRVWLSFLVVSWGLVVLFTAFVESWKTLTLCRALLGVFEAGLLPGGIYIIGAWYRQYECASRVYLFYMSSVVAAAFGPILAYALSLISVGNGNFAHGWRWIFLIEGLITVVAGLVSPFFLVDFPERAKWLTARQKHIASARLMPDQQAKEYIQPTIMQGLKMLWDWKLLAFSMQYFVCSASSYVLTFFSPIILRQGMGFSYVMSQVMLSPPFVFTIFLGMALAIISDKYKTRWPVLCGQSMLTVLGLLIVLYGRLPGVQYFGLFLAVCGITANVPATLSYGQSNTADVRKKGAAAAAMVSMGGAGGICGSTIFRSRDAPRYLPGIWTILGLQLAFILGTFALSKHLKRQNKLADEGKRPALENVEGFRYAP